MAPADHRRESTRVLLVEDNPGDARLLTEYLSEAGILEADPERAETLQAALSRLRDGARIPDVVLLDLGLPDATGLESVEAVVEAAPALPVIVLTGRDDRELALAALRAGAEDYLQKDQLDPDLLARTIRYAVERKRLDQERARAREELEAERARLAEVFREAPAWIALLRGEDHVFEMVNPAYRELVGDREIVGRPVREVFPDLEGEGYFELLDHVYETGESVEVEERSLPLETPEGDKVQKYITFVYQPRREDGEVVGVTAHGVDVTAQVESRKEAEQAERKWSTAIELAPVGITISEVDDGRVHAANEAAAAILGRDTDEMTGATASDLSTWVDREERRALRDRLREQGVVHDEHVRFRHKSGDVRDVRVSVRLLELGGKERLLWTLQDVTEEKERAEALRRSEARYRTLFENNVAGVFRSTPDGRLLECNQAFACILGYDDPEELVGTDTSELYPEDTDREAYLGRLRERGQLVNHELCLERPDGSEVWVLENSTLTEDPESGRSVIEGTFVDITDRKRAEQERRLLSTAVETMRTGVLITGPELEPPGPEIRYVNEAMASMTGYREEELLGETPRLLQGPETDRKELDRLKRRLEEGKPFEGETVNYRKDGTPYELHWQITPLRDESGQVSHFVSVQEDITDRKRLEEELRHRALHDGLTGLANRTLFGDRLAQAVARAERHGELVCVLMLDVDRFKQVNDQFGHAIGDRLLEEVADRLRGSLREEDTAGRLGGDEFAVLLPDLEQLDDLTRVRERLSRELSRPYQLAGESVEVDVTMGGVLQGAGVDEAVQVEESDELLRCADVALYRAKQTTGPSFFLYRGDEESEAGQALGREQELRRAIREDEFELRWQPIARLGDGTIEAVEPLARWRHPERGLLSPGAFIPLAEETGLIHELGELLFRRICREAAGWPERTGRPVRIAPNLSGRQFDTDGLVSTLTEITSASGLDPGRFWLEITETAIARTGETVLDLQGFGFGVLVDDFGTGYSSFHYLRDHRFDGLKIDMSFVQELGRGSRSEALVTTMITMGRSLDMTVVAEGIETEPQRDTLVELGCGLGQGFLLARPMNGEDLEDLLRDRSG